MINKRQAQTLCFIVQEFVKTAQPVASRTIVENYPLDVSPATVRNDMAVLEEVNLLRQPHTSAGRVPTEEGYRYYLEHFVDRSVCGAQHKRLKSAANRVEDTRELLRAMAQALVSLSGETAISSLDARWNHFAGISNLFQKPDFSDVDMLRSLSSIIDNFDAVIRTMYDEAESDMNIWIGRENPFGKEVATVMVKYRLPDGATGLLGLVGPLRMNYEKNIRLISEAKHLLDQTEPL